MESKVCVVGVGETGKVSSISIFIFTEKSDHHEKLCRYWLHAVVPASHKTITK